MLLLTAQYIVKYNNLVDRKYMLGEVLMKFTHKRYMNFALSVWALIGIALVCTVSFIYLSKMVLLDHAGEVTISSVAWLLYNGSPLYTTVDAPERYSIQHGPIVYLVIGGIMKIFGPSILTAKLFSFLSILLVFIVSWYWFTRFLNGKIALWLLGLEAWMMLKYYYLYLARDDAPLLLCTLLSMYFATTTRTKVATSVGVALALGMLINLKADGILYAVPVLTLVQQRFGWRTFFLSIIGMVGVVVMPFLLPNISLINYIHWLTLSTKHGFSLDIFLGNISIAVFFCLIPLSLALYHQCDLINFFKKNRFFIVALGGALLLVSIIGAKRGSGSQHLAPLIPMIMYLIIAISRFISTINLRPSIDTGKTIMHKFGKGLIIIAFIELFFNAFNVQTRIIHYMESNTVNPVMLEELHYIQEKYQGNFMAVGYGENESYKIYDELIPMLVFAGNPYLLDISALNDMGAAGLPIPAATIQELAVGSIKIWLIPKGDIPFSLTNGYNGTSMFNETFRQTFLTDYMIIEKTQYFDVWFYIGDKQSLISAR